MSDLEENIQKLEDRLEELAPGLSEASLRPETTNPFSKEEKQKTKGIRFPQKNGTYKDYTFDDIDMDASGWYEVENKQGAKIRVEEFEAKDGQKLTVAHLGEISVTQTFRDANACYYEAYNSKEKKKIFSEFVENLWILMK